MMRHCLSPSPAVTVSRFSGVFQMYQSISRLLACVINLAIQSGKTRAMKGQAAPQAAGNSGRPSPFARIQSSGAKPGAQQQQAGAATPQAAQLSRLLQQGGAGADGTPLTLSSLATMFAAGSSTPLTTADLQKYQSAGLNLANFPSLPSVRAASPPLHRRRTEPCWVPPNLLLDQNKNQMFLSHQALEYEVDHRWYSARALVQCTTSTWCSTMMFPVSAPRSVAVMMQMQGLELRDSLLCAGAAERGPGGAAAAAPRDDERRHGARALLRHGQARVHGAARRRGRRGARSF